MRTTTASKVEGEFAYLNTSHLRVLRVEDGEEIQAVLPDGRIALCEIINAKKGLAKIKKVSQTFEGKVHFLLVIPLLKKWGTDEVIRFVATLGNSTVFPAITRRTEVRPSEDKMLKMLSRWNKISLEQTKISHARPISVLPPQKLENVLDEVESLSPDHKIVFWEKGQENFAKIVPELKSVLERKGKITLALAMGPEGGIDETEIELMLRRGWKAVKLAERILPALFFPVYILSAIDFVANFVISAD